MRRAAIAWAAFWTAFGLIDYAADKAGLSLSDTSRWLFRTSTPAGRIAFTAAYGTGAMILHKHILKPIIEQAQT